MAVSDMKGRFPRPSIGRESLTRSSAWRTLNMPHFTFFLFDVPHPESLASGGFGGGRRPCRRSVGDRHEGPSPPRNSSPPDETYSLKTRERPRAFAVLRAGCNRSAGLEAALCPAAMESETHLHASPLSDSGVLVFSVNGYDGISLRIVGPRSTRTLQTELCRHCEERSSTSPIRNCGDGHFHRTVTDRGTIPEKR
jgi:hypothetical protein